MNVNKFSVMRGGFTASTFTGLLVVILIIVALYYVYKWVNSTNTQIVTTPLLVGTASTTLTTTDTISGLNAVSMANVSGLNDAGEYSVSFWTYVADTKGFLAPGGSTNLAHLMEISENRFGDSPGKTLLFIGLNPVNAALVVRQSTMDPTETIDNSLTAPSGLKYPLDSLIQNYNNGTTFKSNDRCDIINGVEYQRWVLITVVGNSRTLDTYIDGKLARSCVYGSGFSLSKKGKGAAYFGLNNNNKLQGYFATANLYNYALTPDAVWRIYQDGPLGPFNFTNWLKSFFSSASVSVNINGLNQLNPCSACKTS